MYTLNKLVGGLTNPFTLAWVGIVLGALCVIVGSRKVGSRGEVASRKWLVASGKWLIGLSLVWLWVWATPAMSRMLGGTLERAYLVDGKVPRVEDMPEADAIELHGGSMGIATNLCSRGEMWTSADRVWMAARLWKAQARKVKVEGEGEQWMPKLFVTGTGCAESTIGLLEDFGVPTNALVVADGPRNTEEEAKWVGERLTADAFGIRRDCEDDFAFDPANTRDISPEAKPSSRSESLEGCKDHLRKVRPYTILFGCKDGRMNPDKGYWLLEQALALLPVELQEKIELRIFGEDDTPATATCSCLPSRVFAGAKANRAGRNSAYERSSSAVKKRVLVVTSAWHMKRTMMMYAKYAPNLEAIAAPCDFENTLGTSEPLGWRDFLPNEASLMWNCVTLHEWIGIWGYKWFRRSR